MFKSWILAFAIKGGQVMSILFLFVVGAYPQDVLNGCPMEGNAKSEALKESNKLKNRWNLPEAEDFDSSITIDKLLEEGDDTDRFSANTAVTIVGYIVDVKPGGKETCNCKSGNPLYTDTHIEVSPELESELTPDKNIRGQVLITEVTPRIRIKKLEEGIDWNTKVLRKWIGKKVRIEGWLFKDKIHALESDNLDPKNNKGRKNWRTTIWEVHPITKMEEVE